MPGLFHRGAFAVQGHRGAILVPDLVATDRLLTHDSSRPSSDVHRGGARDVWGRRDTWDGEVSRGGARHGRSASAIDLETFRVVCIAGSLCREEQVFGVID